jgi:hypothetical protein
MMLDMTAELTALEALPEATETNILAPFWVRVLDSWDQHPETATLLSACIHELALRQWHTYELPDELVRHRVANWVRAVWTTQNPDLLHACLATIGSLGLSSCIELVVAAIASPTTDPVVATDMRRQLDSWGPLPLDPWSDLRKFASPDAADRAAKGSPA